MKRLSLTLLAAALVGVTLFGCTMTTAVGDANGHEPVKKVKKNTDPYRG